MNGSEISCRSESSRVEDERREDVSAATRGFSCVNCTCIALLFDVCVCVSPLPPSPRTGMKSGNIKVLPIISPSQTFQYTLTQRAEQRRRMKHLHKVSEKEEKEVEGKTTIWGI